MRVYIQITGVVSNYLCNRIGGCPGWLSMPAIEPATPTAKGLIFFPVGGAMRGVAGPSARGLFICGVET